MKFPEEAEDKAARETLTLPKRPCVTSSPAPRIPSGPSSLQPGGVVPRVSQSSPQPLWAPVPSEPARQPAGESRGYREGATAPYPVEDTRAGGVHPL
ncbi:unnamed protein product, partial [Rangifer tarandus platyrhynchus]|uniref:Uncharacterized protein n=3 Tax=Rangifer tarandus platyrhynchus TaxID=3082113 RepID=A0AC59YKK8_RANTA